MITFARPVHIIFSIFLLAYPFENSLAMQSDDKSTGKNLRVNAKRIEKRILELSEFGKNPQGGVSRVAFSDADIQGRDYIMSLMRDAGLKVRIDTAGNIIGRREGRESKLPPIVFGSHIDSVPDGGNYDGDVGVIGAIECAQVLHENDFITHHPLEVVVFSDEEGGLVGSRVMIGGLSPDALEVVSHSGKTIREGISAIGGNPDKLSEALRQKGEVKAFIELHIEQGSILDSKNIEIGVVSRSRHRTQARATAAAPFRQRNRHQKDDDRRSGRSTGHRKGHGHPDPR